MTFVLSVICRSEVFKTIFQSEMMEGNTGEMNVQECSRESFQAFVEFIYLGSAGELMEKANGGDLYTLAEMYGVNDLKTYLLENLDLESIGTAAEYFAENDDDKVVEIFTKAGWDCVGKMSEESLKGVPVNMARHMLQGHVGKNPKEAFEFILRWVRNNREGYGSGYGHVKELLALIDFRRIDKNYLADTVKTSEIMTTDKIDEITLQQEKSDVWGKSPFDKRKQYGSTGIDTGKYLSITAMTLLPDSEGIAILDGNGSKVCVFRLEGKLVQEFHTFDTLDPWISYGIAVDTQGKFFVSDQGRHNIHVFTKEGAFSRTFGSEGSDDGQFNHPMKMCFDREDHLIICDAGNHRVQIVRKDGVFIRAFDMEKSPEGNRSHPIDVCCDRQDGIIVVSGYVEGIGMSCVQLFSSTGRYVKTIGSSGYQPSQFQNIYGVCISPYGHILVAEKTRGEIIVFDATGEYIRNMDGFQSIMSIEADQIGGHLYTDQIRQHQYMTRNRTQIPRAQYATAVQYHGEIRDNNEQ